MKKGIVFFCLFILSGCQVDTTTPTTQCEENQRLEHGVCVDVVVCSNDQILEDGVCIDPTPTCQGDEVLRNGQCIVLADPVISMEGEQEITIEAGETYSDPGVSASYDNDTIPVTIEGIENIDGVGTYTLTYYAVSDNGQAAEPKTRIVHVVDTTAPTLSWSRYDDDRHELNRPYPYQNVIVSDNTNSYDEITLSIEGTVDVTTLGEYQLIYTATDSYGNQSEPIIKTVEVVPVDETKDFTERYLMDHTALYNPKKMENNYTYDLIEWVHQALVIEDGEYVPKLFFFLHNDIDGKHVLNRIDFVCSSGNIEYILEDEIIDYAFEIPLHCLSGNNINIITYAHDENDPGQKWTYYMTIPSDHRSVEGILGAKLRSGNLM